MYQIPAGRMGDFLLDKLLCGGVLLGTWLLTLVDNMFESKGIAPRGLANLTSISSVRDYLHEGGGLCHAWGRRTSNPD